MAGGDCSEDGGTAAAADSSSDSAAASDQGKPKKSPFLPPCRVCGSSASGLHYGVNTCEACKGFFRRSLGRKTPYPPCSHGGSCDLQLESRNSCSCCRLGKCYAVGMSKSAIKTGRYTLTKRTLDTLEVRSQQAGFSSAETKGGDASASATSCPSQDSRPHPTSDPTPPPADAQTVELCRVLNEAFRHHFPDTTCLYEHLQRIEGMIEQALRRDGLNRVESVVVIESEGDSWQIKSVKKITKQVEILRSFERLNSSVSSDLAKYRTASRELFESWSVNVDRFVHSAVSFAKKIPGFCELAVDDQVSLIKYGRSEINSIVKFKHFSAKYEACIDYHSDSGTMHIFPNAVLSQIILASDTDEASRHTYCFTRCLRQLRRLDITLQDLSLLCALIICSPDRENLTDAGKEKTTLVNQQLVKALEYCLSQTHPGQPSILAKFLMVLPSLREIQELNNRALSEVQQRLQPALTPLLQEMLPAPP